MKLLKVLGFLAIGLFSSIMSSHADDIFNYRSTASDYVMSGNTFYKTDTDMSAWLANHGSNPVGAGIPTVNGPFGPIVPSAKMEDSKFNHCTYSADLVCCYTGMSDTNFRKSDTPVSAWLANHSSNPVGAGIPTVNGPFGPIVPSVKVEPDN